MNYVTAGYEPRAVLEIFEELCAIPHGSGNEKGVADYVEAYAKKRGLFVLRDETGNVFVRKEATEGYENTPAILLQGHMDMVCEKNADSDHNFLTDGLKLSVKDGFLWADGTTLGGDDGIAVAMMLALLDTEEHPRLECLFTVEEETGLAGAEGFDCTPVTAKRMINLDSEEEWQITAGCAGGMRTEVEFACSREASKDKPCLTIAAKGFAGGHSGTDINSGKTNAIVVMARLLATAYDKAAFKLVGINGGGKDNAIARECFATVCFENEEELSAAKKAVISESVKLKRELCQEDLGYSVSIGKGEPCEECLTKELTRAVIAFLSTVRTGVLKMSNHIKGLVEFSRNLGVAECGEDKVRFILSTRSSVEAQLDTAVRELDMLCALAGASCRHYARYPGWEYEPQSALRDAYISAYRSLFGKDLTVGVIHAGLECGILSSKMEGMDIISIGPDMYDIHSPDEHLDLASTERVWKAVLAVVRNK
ncbi:MAG: aminoacyl-histidine dipeptidase [Clostridia bacterium]|nr:aminoacyl-histidine dipeptidase [Clostridia bacterium]